jgi:predicted naringenin-chalcone synthase
MIFPGTRDAMTWRIGDHGFEMTLSTQVPGLIEAHAGDWIRAWLSGEGVALQEVSGWAIHPGGPRILDAVRRTLDLPAAALESSHQVLDGYGNMSSATLVFVLQQLLRRSVNGPVVCIGFGPGLSVEALLLSFPSRSDTR